MKNKLYLLEWKLCSTRVWLTWLVLWGMASFTLLSALMLTRHLIGINLPYEWFLLWLFPPVLIGIKCRLTEQGSYLYHSVHWFSLRLFSYKTAVLDGYWSVDRVGGRYRMNRITRAGKIIHYPWRTREIPLFMPPNGAVFKSFKESS
ncbi:hypothetical protein EAE89_05680 [Photorhabdus heterorhabditis]|uniref:Conjugal transfer protein n=1 Tax=Photorhabdus heterorhabditis TaxID=880156 RepID=A0ABR5KE17_9GAMM|nr:hypothetical protein [Photorhabdus heterorhabditis]KOY62854.1 hypothetical protein AM629_06485 [Photorhabdus heterorhabditis]MBS9441231.1 hypothetical protein [Photorhabdus heterorhabditis]